MTIEDSLFFYECELEREIREDCENRAIETAFIEYERNKALDFRELKLRYYLHNLVEAYREMLG